jgi:hypothetical protein
MRPLAKTFAVRHACCNGTAKIHKPRNLLKTARPVTHISAAIARCPTQQTRNGIFVARLSASKNSKQKPLVAGPF